MALGPEVLAGRERGADTEAGSDREQPACAAPRLLHGTGGIELVVQRGDDPLALLVRLVRDRHDHAAHALEHVLHAALALSHRPPRGRLPAAARARGAPAPVAT